MEPHGIRAGVRRLFHLRLRSQQHVERDADAELQAVIDARVEYLVARGVREAEARAMAIERLGQSLGETKRLLHTSALRREHRMRFREAIDDLRQDFRFAARTLRRDAGFTALAVLIIGLGIGASATVFSVANTLLLRPLPFHDASQLIWIGNNGVGELEEWSTQQANYVDLAAASKTVSALAAFNPFFGVGDTRLGTEGDVIRVSAVQVTTGFFPLLGITPKIGRNFSANETGENAPPVALVSHSLWMRRFSGDPRLVGKAVIMNGSPVTVIGVLPESFDFGSVFAPGARVDVFPAFPMTERSGRWGNTLAIVGRLKPGVALTQATAELVSLGQTITSAHPERNWVRPRVMSLREHVSGHVARALMMLVLAVGVVMLIVCANLSSLLLARATTRQTEMAVRVALGAGRGRLIRQLLTESVVLSSCGAALGLVLASVGTAAIARSEAIDLPLLGQVRIDLASLAFIALLAVAAGVIFGLAPALQLREAAVHDAMRASGRGTTHSRRGQWVRRSLVVSEIALACMLVVGSGLLVRSFLKILEVDPGFRAERVLSVRVDPEGDTRKTQEAFNAYASEVLRLARQAPGLQDAAIADGLPLAGNRSWGIGAKGVVYERGQRPQAFIRVASDGYIGTMGMRLVAGRDFTPDDGPKAQQVIIINETAARTLFPGEDAVGRFVNVGGSDEQQVVGVVGDVRHLALDRAAGLQVYFPLSQTRDFNVLELVVRTTLAPAAFATAIRSALAPAVPDLATNQIQTLTGLVDRSVSQRKFFTSMLGAFALFALGLALLGIYGVISYTVSHRTQEIGVRIALGATAAHIQGRILRETLELAVAGIALGTAGSCLLARTLRGFLFGVSSYDPLTFAAMLTVVTAVALVSGYLPARRASRIDPNVAFRSG